jgi:hypothetical protein
MSLDEILLAKSKLKHFMPNKTIKLQRNTINMKEQQLMTKLKNFTMKMEEIFKNKRNENENRPSNEELYARIFSSDSYVDFIFKGEEII